MKNKFLKMAQHMMLNFIYLKKNISNKKFIIGIMVRWREIWLWYLDLARWVKI
jgi:hypothetical protein